MSTIIFAAIQNVCFQDLGVINNLLMVDNPDHTVVIIKL